MNRFKIACCITSAMLILTGCGAGEAETADKVTITEENIVEETITIEGISGEYDFLFLTDTHMVVSSGEDSEQVAANAAERGPMFVDDKGVSSVKQFPAWMSYAEEQQVDAVLLGGDIIDYPSRSNLEYLSEQLNTLSMPYLYTLGNHDWTYPWEYMTDKGEEEYLPLLEPMMQGNTAIQRLDVGELTIVAVDNSAGQVNGEALEAYEEILKEGRPTICLVHVPFMTQSVLETAKEVWSSPVVIGAGNYGGIYPNDESNAFLDMTTASDSPVVVMLAGHVHFYDRDFVGGDTSVLQLVGDGGYKRQGMMLHIKGTEK